MHAATHRGLLRGRALKLRSAVLTLLSSAVAVSPPPPPELQLKALQVVDSRYYWYVQHRTCTKIYYQLYYLVVPYNNFI
eukprot:SAG11_NODE_14393_length_613_cov_1.830739_1_plen_78_part_10